MGAMVLIMPNYGPAFSLTMLTRIINAEIRQPKSDQGTATSDSTYTNGS